MSISNKNEHYSFTLPSKLGKTINTLVANDLKKHQNDSASDLFHTDFKCNTTTYKLLKQRYPRMNLSPERKYTDFPLLFLMAQRQENGQKIPLTRMVEYINKLCGSYINAEDRANISISEFKELGNLGVNNHDIYVTPIKHLEPIEQLQKPQKSKTKAYENMKSIYDMYESVLDKPQSELDESMWSNENGKYIPTPEAAEKINGVIKWVMEKTKMQNFKVHIIGSITSNQFSEKSDVDVHFISKAIIEEKADELNKIMKNLFKTEYATQNDTKIGTHEIEIYFQTNEFQDMMSVGCYDYLNNEWLVGPEFVSTEHDPYAEYYDEDMKHVNSIIYDIRNVILEIYELVIVINNSTDEEFKDYEYTHLKDKLVKAANIFTSTKQFRKVFSSPNSKEDALSKRASREWKIADSAFKMLDEFGYLGVLKDMTVAWDNIQANEDDRYNIIQSIM